MGLICVGSEGVDERVNTCWLFFCFFGIALHWQPKSNGARDSSAGLAHLLRASIKSWQGGRFYNPECGCLTEAVTNWHSSCHFMKLRACQKYLQLLTARRPPHFLMMLDSLVRKWGIYMIQKRFHNSSQCYCYCFVFHHAPAVLCWLII